MTKEQLIKIIENLNIDFNEGIQADLYNSKFPRLVFWDFAWEPIVSSGKKYNTIVTYQISFFNTCLPRESSELKQMLKSLIQYEKNPIVSHEYVEKDKVWHSYFSIDVLENVF